MKASKKLMSLLLVVAMLVCAIPFQVFAKTVNEETGAITVPVAVKFNGKTYDKSITIPADTDVTLDEAYAMDPATGLVKDASDKVFGAWYANNVTEAVTGNVLHYTWLKDEAPEDYALTLELNPKTAPTEPTETEPTEPKPTEPKPTEPKPTEPKPT
ncbi:MAG: hypothetical protein ACI4PL_03585, partial [Faecousia sp.]